MLFMMSMSGQRLGIGIVGTIIVILMIFSVSAVVCKATISCPSGYVPSQTSSNQNQIHTDKTEGNFNKGNQKQKILMSTEMPSSPSPTPPTTTSAPIEKIKISLFTGNDHGGQYHTMHFEPGQNCTVLPGRMVNRVKSVDTHGNCFSLCDTTDCNEIGWCIPFYPGSPNHNRLRKLRFHNRAKAAVPCETPPS